MKLIVGLGNPGKKYELTRHNVGFLALDHYLSDKTVIGCQSKFKAQVCELHQDGQKMLFVKPQNYMNLSGQVVSGLISFYKLDPKKDLLVVHDDKDLSFGTIKHSIRSGAAGHNGVQNIIDQLGTKNFDRIRIGVESRDNTSPIDTADFVLQKFTEQEITELKETILPETIKLLEEFITQK